MANDFQPGLQDYLSIFRRRSLLLAGIFMAVLMVSIVVAAILPATYRASGIIIVESQQIADNIVQSTIRNQLDEQINVIKQRLLTRESLLQLADKHGLLEKASSPIPTPEQINALRNRIFIETDSSSAAARTNRQGQQVIVFGISYEDRQPQVAYAVTRDLIDQFLDWNLKLRTESAAETTEFLTQESDKLKSEVDRLEKLIFEYKQQNRHALPEQLTLRMTMLSRAENDLREVERDLRSIKEEIRTLEVELAAARRGTGADDNSPQSLPALKTELARLSTLYKENHPDIRRLKRRIEALESTPEPSSTSDSPGTTSLAAFRLQARIDSDKARLASLTQQKELLQKKIAENESAMIQTPKVGQGLDILLRDRDIAQKKFEEFRSKRMNAKIAENLESESKFGRFSVLEPPLMPEKPFKPNRMKILLIGFVLALASAAGIVFMLETLDKRIRGTEALTHILGQRPLAIIPYLPNPQDDAQKKRTLKITLITTAAAVLLFFMALLAMYPPFSKLLVKLLAG